MPRWHGPRPRIVCLCGSTRFQAAFQEANRRLGLEGVIVLTVSMFGHSGDLTPEQCQDGHPTKTALDELHKRKIDLADEVLVINVDGYIGSSTASEIAYAEKHGKPVRYLEEERGQVAGKSEQHSVSGPARKAERPSRERLDGLATTSAVIDSVVGLVVTADQIATMSPAELHQAGVPNVVALEARIEQAERQAQNSAAYHLKTSYARWDERSLALLEALAIITTDGES